MLLGILWVVFGVGVRDAVTQGMFVFILWYLVTIVACLSIWIGLVIAFWESEDWRKERLSPKIARMVKPVRETFKSAKEWLNKDG